MTTSAKFLHLKKEWYTPQGANKMQVLAEQTREETLQTKIAARKKRQYDQNIVIVFKDFWWELFFLSFSICQ